MMLEPWAHGLPAAVYTLIRAGYLAVGMFFVLSGFVLSQSYGSTSWSRKNLVRYAIGRVSRIYPVYALSLLFVVPFIAGSTVPGKPWFIANYAFLLQGWTAKIPVHWNTPAWSLTCEVFFYLCFPLVVGTLRRLNGRAAIVVFVAACFLPALLWRAGVPSSFKPLIHLADFLTGILAARAFEILRSLKGNWIGRGYWLYLPATAAIVLLMLYPMTNPGLLDLSGTLRPFTALALLGFALEGGLVARILSTRVPVYLGKASYAIYILHVPLLWNFRRWWQFWFPDMSSAMSAFCYIVITVCVSAVVFRYFEEPANRYLRDLGGPAKAPRKAPEPAYSSYAMAE
jgi:peptidoglycan/LPS O-acetylase OafA/YrhL